MSRTDQVNKTVLRQRGDQTPNRAVLILSYDSVFNHPQHTELIITIICSSPFILR